MRPISLFIIILFFAFSANSQVTADSVVYWSPASRRLFVLPIPILILPWKLRRKIWRNHYWLEKSWKRHTVTKQKVGRFSSSAIRIPVLRTWLFQQISSGNWMRPWKPCIITWTWRMFILPPAGSQVSLLTMQKQEAFKYGAIILVALLVLIAFLMVNRYRAVHKARQQVEI